MRYDTILLRKSLVGMAFSKSVVPCVGIDQWRFLHYMFCHRGCCDCYCFDFQGQAEARIHIAEAEAVAIQKITDAVGQSTNPANYLIAQKYIQMMEELAKNENQKTVYLPFEATGVMGSIGGIKELFKG